MSAIAKPLWIILTISEDELQTLEDYYNRPAITQTQAEECIHALITEKRGMVATARHETVTREMKHIVSEVVDLIKHPGGADQDEVIRRIWELIE